MIRYVLAVLLAVALLALAMPSVERAASENTDRQVSASVARIDEAAASLVADEEPTPAAHPAPRRVVDVRLPRETLTTEGVDHFEIEPDREHGYSSVRYVLADGRTRTGTLEEPIVVADPTGTRRLESGGGGAFELVLTLEVDADDEPVVVARWQ